MAKSALAQQPLPFIHVLLVEDNASDAFLVERLLGDGQAAQYKTYCVKTQAAAIALLTDKKFDVCLLDLTLPDASGFSAMIDIQDAAPDMPVLILTGINDMALAKRAVGRGAQDYLLKDELETESLARSINYAIERKRAEKELFHRANTDALTGLANREAFLSHLQLALDRGARSDMRVAVLFIDLDRFKPVNDLYGHDVGDEILKTVASRIRNTLRTYDMPARFGGDEFAVLLENISDPRDTANIAQKIVNALAEPIPHQHHSLEIGASIGVAFSDAKNAPETLLQHADTAMYHAKKEGGGTYRFYAESMLEEVLERLKLEEDLRTALEANELQLYYQPYVNPGDNKIMGVEVLIRWAHPERGMLSAHQFLPAAESARLMPHIAKWTCSQLMRDIALWNAEDVPPLAIAINLSVSQLDAPNLIEWFMPIVNKDFLGAHSLVVEIPEAAITPISGSRYMTIGKLHELGIGLHLDHYGCCSLPLMTLTSLPFDMLKIDLSLIQTLNKELSNDLLINAAIMLAHHLDIKVGAVGVEEPWQAAMLKAQDCDTMQGYLTAQPMPAETLVGWLARKSSAQTD